MVNEHTFGMVHHLAHAVVVGHGEGYGVGVCLAQISLGIVGHIVVVLIPVHGGGIILIGNTVLVFQGIFFSLEHFPSSAEDFVCSLLYGRYGQTHSRIGQYRSRRIDITDGRLTTLELNMNIYDMLFYECLIAATIGTTFLVCIFVHNRYDTVLAQVEDIRLAGHIERRGFYR